jgi:hypothetical protein
MHRKKAEGNSAVYLHVIIQACKTFNEHVRTLVREFITPSNEEVQSLVQIKIIMPGKWE